MRVQRACGVVWRAAAPKGKSKTFIGIMVSVEAQSRHGHFARLISDFLSLWRLKCMCMWHTYAKLGMTR